METSENGKKYSIQFELSNNGPIFYSIKNETTLFENYLLVTAAVMKTGLQPRNFYV